MFPLERDIGVNTLLMSVISVFISMSLSSWTSFVTHLSHSASYLISLTVAGTHTFKETLRAYPVVVFCCSDSCFTVLRGLAGLGSHSSELIEEIFVKPPCVLLVPLLSRFLGSHRVSRLSNPKKPVSPQLSVLTEKLIDLLNFPCSFPCIPTGIQHFPLWIFLKF